jgi:hypothetical protein
MKSYFHKLEGFQLCCNCGQLPSERDWSFKLSTTAYKVIVEEHVMLIPPNLISK